MKIISHSGTAISVISGLICGASLLSLVTTKDPNIKSFAFNLGVLTAGISVSAAATSTLSKNSLDSQVQEFLSKNDNELNRLKLQNQRLETENTKYKNILQEVQGFNEKLKLQVNNQEEIIKGLQLATELKLQELVRKLSTEDTFHLELTTAIKDEFYQLIFYRIDTDYERLGDMAVAKLEDERYQNIHPQLQKYYQNIKNYRNQHCDDLKSIPQLEGTALEVIKSVADIYFNVSDQISALKVRFRNLLNTEERLTLGELNNALLEYQDPKQYVPAEKVKKALSLSAIGNEEIILKLSNSFNLNKASFEELKEQVADLLDEIDAKNLEIHDLKNEVRKLNLPRHFYGSSNIPLAGNDIINYYYEKYGYRLDGMNWEESETGYKLLFSIRRNPGIGKKELEADNSIEQLAAFTNALHKTLPEFDFNYQHCLLTLSVQLRKVVKPELTPDDIFRECDVIRADKFGSTIKRYHIDKTGKPTLRVMSATGGGKGIMVKNLVDFYLQNIPGYEIWLSDPQHGSDEDYWYCDKTAKSPSEAKQLFNRYAQVLRQRDDKTSTNPKTPIIAVFDEFDKKHDLEDKKTASDIWTTIRHHNMRLVLIGQCSEVGRNKWTWDDMLNCGLLFIENGIDTFVKHATKDLGMKADDFDAFVVRYNKVSKWMVQANKEIDLPENHYRIACLYVNGRAYLMELPRALKAPLTSGKSWLVSEPFETSKPEDTMTQWTEISHPSELHKPAICCKHCGSTKFEKHSRVKDAAKHRYLCLNVECGKTFVADKLTNSN